jgi:hypothetical protein
MVCLRYGLATGDAENFSGDVAGFLGCEKDVGGSDFGWLSRPPQGHLLSVGFYFGLGYGRWNERCPDRPRRDHVHPDAFISEHSGQPFGEVDNSSLGGGVVQQLRGRIRRLDRGGVDDACWSVPDFIDTGLGCQIG